MEMNRASNMLIDADKLCHAISDLAGRRPDDVLLYSPLIRPATGRSYGICFFRELRIACRLFSELLANYKCVCRDKAPSCRC